MAASRRLHLAALTAVLALLLSPVSGLAACDPTTEPDRSDIANARAAVDSHCTCDDTVTHGDYVSCAVDQANMTLVNKDCARFVKRCAARSTCGKPGFVTCCRTNRRGKTKCSIKRDALHCRMPTGGSACVGNVPSCCDACPEGGCPTTTTTQTTPTTCPPSTTTTTLPLCESSPFPQCSFNGVCFNGQTCGVDVDHCVCNGPPPVCGQWGILACGGTCSQPGTSCVLDNLAPPGCPSVPICRCVPTP